MTAHQRHRRARHGSSATLSRRSPWCQDGPVILSGGEAPGADPPGVNRRPATNGLVPRPCATDRLRGSFRGWSGIPPPPRTRSAPRRTSVAGWCARARATGADARQAGAPAEAINAGADRSGYNRAVTRRAPREGVARSQREAGAVQTRCSRPAAAYQAARPPPYDVGAVNGRLLSEQMSLGFAPRAKLERSNETLRLRGITGAVVAEEDPEAMADRAGAGGKRALPPSLIRRSPGHRGAGPTAVNRRCIQGAAGCSCRRGQPCAADPRRTRCGAPVSP